MKTDEASKIAAYQAVIKRAEDDARKAERAAGAHAQLCKVVKEEFGTADPDKLDKIASKLAEEADVVEAELDAEAEEFDKLYGDKL